MADSGDSLHETSAQPRDGYVEAPVQDEQRRGDSRSKNSGDGRSNNGDNRSRSGDSSHSSRHKSKRNRDKAQSSNDSRHTTGRTPRPADRVNGQNGGRGASPNGLNEPQPGTSGQRIDRAELFGLMQEFMSMQRAQSQQQDSSSESSDSPDSDSD